MVNGGVSSNRFVLDFLSNILGKPVNTHDILDISALGAALLAGLEFGVFKDLESITQLKNSKKTTLSQHFKCHMDDWYNGWKEIIENQNQK
jgi:glycerol kinase